MRMSVSTYSYGTLLGMHVVRNDPILHSLQPNYIAERHCKKTLIDV